MNEWLNILKQQVKKYGLTAVSKQLGVSKTTVSQTVNDKYPGDLARVKKLVEGVYLKQCVNCPVLGELAQHECMKHQARKGVSSNPVHIQLYKACRSGCPYSNLAEQLKRPIELTFDATRKQKLYDYEGAIRRLTKQAEGAESLVHAKQLIQLLSSELEVLAIKYNRLIKKEKENG